VGSVALALLAAAVPAQAAFPGQNGKIAFSRVVYDPDTDTSSPVQIYTVNPDGTATTNISNSSSNDYVPEWSPDGQVIAFQSDRDGSNGIYTMNANGTNPVRLTGNPATDADHAWSPDGTKIAFVTSRDGNNEIYTMNANGTSQTRLTSNSVEDLHPEWSPDGSKIAFSRSGAIYVMNADGSAQTSLGPGGDPDWLPSGGRIAFAYGGIWTMNSDGTDRVRLTTEEIPFFIDDPTWSPDGTKFAAHEYCYFGGCFLNVITIFAADGTREGALTFSENWTDGSPDWQPIPINSYPRPKGATPFLTYLVPAYAECTTPNREHGPALSFGSCNPPTQTSNALTIGSADSNGKPTKSVSSVRFDTVVGNPSRPGDQDEVKITAQVIDVFTPAGLNDYAGELTAKTPLRITDKLNTPQPGGPGAGTVSDIPYEFTIPCAETADTTIGGACLLSTTADALAPGAVTEGKRSIWALGQVAVYDADDDPFMKQGIFVP
jgi:hypothetical protein